MTVRFTTERIGRGVAALIWIWLSAVAVTITVGAIMGLIAILTALWR